MKRIWTRFVNWYILYLKHAEKDNFLYMLIVFFGIAAGMLLTDFLPKGDWPLLILFGITLFLAIVSMQLCISTKRKIFGWTAPFLTGFALEMFSMAIAHLSVTALFLALGAITFIKGEMLSTGQYMALVCGVPLLVLALAIKIIFDVRKRKKEKKAIEAKKEGSV